MHFSRAAAVVVLMLQPLFARAQRAEGDASAVEYFARACVEGTEHVAVYLPTTQSITDITTGGNRGTFLWDRSRFEQLCALPQLYIYHCHATRDVLARFPSGSDAG